MSYGGKQPKRDRRSPLMPKGSQKLRPVPNAFGAATTETVYGGDIGGGLETEIQRSPTFVVFLLPAKWPFKTPSQPERFSKLLDDLAGTPDQILQQLKQQLNPPDWLSLMILIALQLKKLVGDSLEVGVWTPRDDWAKALLLRASGSPHFEALGLVSAENDTSMSSIGQRIDQR